MRGIGLIDALIALAILSFGMLALTRFQGRMVSQTTEAQSRSTAMRLADELMSTALVDPANLACYTMPATGVCGSAVRAGQHRGMEGARARRAAGQPDGHGRGRRHPADGDRRLDGQGIARRAATHGGDRCAMNRVAPPRSAASRSSS